MELPEILINYLTEKHTTIPIESIVGIFQYGSRVYGTASENSDWDFVVINNANQDGLVETDEIDIHYLSVETYINKLKEHDIMCLEIYYSNKQLQPIKEFDVDFELDLQKLRHSVSSTCSNSFVKFKKKLTIEEEDNYIGVKSLFHSIRIAELGTRIAMGARNVMTTDTYLWERIKEDAKECNYDWQTLNDIYKPIFNDEMSEFRAVAPKVKK